MYIKSNVIMWLMGNTRMFHVVLSGEALLRLASFLRPSELLSNRDR